MLQVHSLVGAAAGVQQGVEELEARHLHTEGWDVGGGWWGWGWGVNNRLSAVMWKRQ